MQQKRGDHWSTHDFLDYVFCEWFRFNSVLMLWGAQEKPASLIFFKCIIASSPSCVPSDWGCPPSWHGCSPPSHPRHRPSSASAQTPQSRWNLIKSCHFIGSWFFPQLFNQFWSMTVVVEVGQPDHQLDVLLQEALSKVEHAHAELFFGDLSITVRVKSPDVKKVSVRRRRWLGGFTWMQSSSPPSCQCCPPESPTLIDSLKRSSPACASSGWTRWGPSSRCGRHQLLPWLCSPGSSR